MKHRARHRRVLRDDGRTTTATRRTCSRSSIRISCSICWRASPIRRSSSRTFGLRSLSKAHQQHPFVFGNASVAYEPAEASTKLKGGNSNWRGPVWFPTTFLMIETLRKLEKAYSGTVRVALRDGQDMPEPSHARHDLHRHARRRRPRRRAPARAAAA